MEILRFAQQGRAAIGVVQNGTVHDLATVLPDAPTEMTDVITGGTDLQHRIENALKTVGPGLPIDSITLLSPIPRPGKFICMGLNYAEHVKEGGRDLPSHPTFFLRVQTSLLPPDGAIVAPLASDRLDFEAELLVVIGKRAHGITAETALDHVYGYTAFNDGSLRDFQRHTTQWTMGKNFDATGPFGPSIVTADALPPGGAGLRIRSILNGQVMQDGNTRDMIFGVAEIIAYAAQAMTLEPGDVIATGTPSGVGFARTPPVFMRAGDVVEIDIEGLRPLVNRVVAAH